MIMYIIALILHTAIPNFICASSTAAPSSVDREVPPAPPTEDETLPPYPESEDETPPPPPAEERWEPLIKRTQKEHLEALAPDISKLLHKYLDTSLYDPFLKNIWYSKITPPTDELIVNAYMSHDGTTVLTTTATLVSRYL